MKNGAGYIHTFLTVDFRTAWESAWKGNHFYAVRNEGGDESIVGSMSKHPDGKVWISAYNERGEVEYRQKFTRERYARATEFLAKRYLSEDDNVRWLEADYE